LFLSVVLIVHLFKKAAADHCVIDAVNDGRSVDQHRRCCWTFDKAGGVDDTLVCITTFGLTISLVDADPPMTMSCSWSWSCTTDPFNGQRGRVERQQLWIDAQIHAALLQLLQHCRVDLDCGLRYQTAAVESGDLDAARCCRRTCQLQLYAAAFQSSQNLHRYVAVGRRAEDVAG
jgi:hypothetical protein